MDVFKQIVVISLNHILWIQYHIKFKKISKSYIFGLNINGNTYNETSQMMRY